MVVEFIEPCNQRKINLFYYKSLLLSLRKVKVEFDLRVINGNDRTAGNHAVIYEVGMKKGFIRG